MTKILISLVLLLALCSARLTIPIRQHSVPNSVNSHPQTFLTTDDEQSSKTLKLTVNNTVNEFSGVLYVGSNTKFHVIFQTARDETWLPKFGCEGCPSYDHYYECEESPTCDITYESSTLYYPEGKVTGYPGHELIGLTQDFKVKSQILWARKAQRYNFTSFGFYPEVDGVLGLGSNQSVDGFIDLAYQQNYIQDKVFSFTVDYNLNFGREYFTNTSYLSVGYIPENKVNKLTWIPLSSSSTYSWAISISNTKVGDKIVDTSSEPFSNQAIIDSTVQGLYLARSTVQELISQLEKLKTSSMTSPDRGYYLCNDNYLDQFPSITLKVAGIDIVLNVFAYLDFFPAGSSATYWMWESSRKDSSGDDNARQYYCELNIHESKTGVQILGNTFLLNNFVAFSKANQTVGIYQEYKPISLGWYKTPLQRVLPFVLGAALLLVIIILVVKKRRANNLQKELSNDSNDVYSSTIGINN